MYKLEFTLKQHTPIIHFQHDQEGATLRATEVKPKLDKFLIEKLKLTEIKTIEGKEKEVPKTEFESYFINGGKLHLALDYKMKIFQSETNEVFVLKKQFPCFFATMGVEEHEKKALIYNKDNCEVRLLFFNIDLLKLIEINICEFFAYNNFGTRQNKGFGSFYPNQEGLSLYKKINDFKFNGVFKTQFTETSGDLAERFKNLFFDIDIFYKILKSGYNFPNHPLDENKRPIYGKYGAYRTYYKSFLAQYMLNKNIGNEKRFIKENFFSKNVRIESDSLNKYFIRASLGLTDNYEFRGKERIGKVDVKSVSGEINRYKSPLTFKIFNNIVFIHNTNTKIPIENFIFSEGQVKREISTIESIDINDLLNEYFKHFEMNVKNDFIKTYSSSLRNLPNPLKELYNSLNRIQITF
jgi:hypothetical protein